MARIVFIGAGSVTFGTTLLNDILQVGNLAGSEIVLMDIDEKKALNMADYAKKIVETEGLDFKIITTTNQREAVRSADYVLTIFQVGTVDAMESDYKIPMKYGVDQCIADCVGPGGVFRGLRAVPILKKLVEDMMELCPHAVLLNYANPMCINCIAIAKTGDIQFVGLCHGIQVTIDLIGGYLNINPKEIDFVAAGINHMAWFLNLEHKGKDIYPAFKRLCEKPEYYLGEKVRCEVMRHFGYFMTETTGHLSEYLPWFRKNQKALDLYCDQPGEGGESGTGYEFTKKVADFISSVDVLSLETGKLWPRSAEYCSYIIEALEGGPIFKLNGNVKNKNYITNLPNSCAVEVPIFVDKSGLNPVVVGDLPPALAAMNQSNVSEQILAADAALYGDTELLVAAIAIDPLTSAVLTLNETREMVAEMLEAEKKYLPQFEGKAVRKVPTISIPSGTKPVPTPNDPARAIAQRFAKLFKYKLD